MGNGKFLQFLTLLLCLCFGYFTYKAYSDVQQVKEENAFCMRLWIRCSSGRR